MLHTLYDISTVGPGSTEVICTLRGRRTTVLTQVPNDQNRRSGLFQTQELPVPMQTQTYVEGCYGITVWPVRNAISVHAGGRRVPALSVDHFVGYVCTNSSRHNDPQIGFATIAFEHRKVKCECAELKSPWIPCRAGFQLFSSPRGIGIAVRASLICMHHRTWR